MKHSCLVTVVEIVLVEKTTWVTLDGRDHTDWHAQARNVAQFGGTDDPRIRFSTGIASQQSPESQKVVIQSIDQLDGEAGMELIEPQWSVTCPTCSEVITCEGVDGNRIICPDCNFEFVSVT